MKSQTCPEEQRQKERRNGMIGIIVGMTIVLAAGVITPPEGGRSGKVNATLFVSGVTGLLAVAMSFKVKQPTRVEKWCAVLLFVLSTATLFEVDFSGPLLGRVATPLLVAIAFVLMAWFKRAFQAGS